MNRRRPSPPTKLSFGIALYTSHWNGGTAKKRSTKITVPRASPAPGRRRKNPTMARSPAIEPMNTAVFVVVSGRSAGTNV